MSKDRPTSRRQKSIPKRRRSRSRREKTTPILALPPLPVRKPRYKRKAAKTVFLPPLPKRKPVRRLKRNRKKAKTGPKNTKLAASILKPTKPRPHPSKVKDGDWTPKLISMARQQCTNLGIDITPLPPLKKGICGNPAAVLLAKIKTATIRPAATLSCPMAASLQRWFQKYVQPLAQKHFGKKVAQIRNVSSYVCRNRYGDTTTRISEHAYANALDIASFELQGGEKISVLKDWENTEGEKSAFLHALHKSACKIFGTVLGPDANAAHKDHFHLDKAPRKRSNYCR